MRKLLTITLLTLAGLLSSCFNDVEHTNIPYAYVNFIIDTAISGSDNQLREDLTGNSRIYTTKQPAVQSSGYGSYGYAGVVVVRAFDNLLYAFDICCPFEVDKNCALVADGYFMVCNKCHSQFEIGNGTGRVNKGPATYPLRRYRVVELSGYKYRIYNNN